METLGFLLLTIHWFNPLMWLGYVLLCRDIEYACDEKVIGELGREQRADYSQALLICGAHSRMKYACPVAFGEVGVKERVKNVLNYKKPGIWITVAAVTAVIVAAVCFLTAPPVEAEGIPETTETMADTTAAAQDTTAPSTETESSDNVEGYLYVDNVTGSGLQLYCKTRGEAWHKVTACGPYRLEKKTESGWEELPVKLGDATWAPITYEYYGLDVIDWPVNWVALYGVLPEGTYRLWTQPLENEPEYSVAFEITASEDQQIRDAAARCTAALQALLDKESYALYYFHTTELELSRLPADKFIGEEYSEDHIQIYKSGEDFLEFQLREEDGTLRVVDGKMKKNGVKYRLDNEEEGNSRTPVAGWSQWPDVEDGRFTWWVSSASFVQANILSDPETYSISDGEVTFRMQPMNSPMMWYTQLGQVYTFRFDENGELKSVTIVTEGTDYGGFDVDVTYTTVLTVDSVNDPAIAEKIAAQDVNFYRSFSWEEERALYEVTAEYKNVAQTSVSTAPEAIALAKNECDVAYTKIVVYRDEAAGMWKVEFQRHYGYQGYYNVYLGNDGITRLIAMGEAKHS